MLKESNKLKTEPVKRKYITWTGRPFLGRRRRRRLHAQWVPSFPPNSIYCIGNGHLDTALAGAAVPVRCFRLRVYTVQFNFAKHVKNDRRPAPPTPAPSAFYWFSLIMREGQRNGSHRCDMDNKLKGFQFMASWLPTPRKFFNFLGFCFAHHLPSWENGFCDRFRKARLDL